MQRMSLRRGAPLVALLIVALGGLAFAACGSDSSTSDSVKNSNVLTAIYVMDKAGLHDIDTSINTNKTIPATAANTATQLQTVALITDWPTQQLKDDAKKMADIFATMAKETGAATPDMQKAGDAAHAAHEGEHDFSHEVWAYLQSKAGVTSQPTKPAASATAAN
jgi:hypothetical protein